MEERPERCLDCYLLVKGPEAVAANPPGTPWCECPIIRREDYAYSEDDDPDDDPDWEDGPDWDDDPE